MLINPSQRGIAALRWSAVILQYGSKPASEDELVHRLSAASISRLRMVLMRD